MEPPPSAMPWKTMATTGQLTALSELVIDIWYSDLLTENCLFYASYTFKNYAGNYPLLKNTFGVFHSKFWR